MIKEICRFVETLEKQVPDLFEEGAKLKDGIYVALDIGLEDGNFFLKNVDENGDLLKEDIGLFKKNDDLTPFLNQCRMILQESYPVSPAKIFNPNKKIFNLTCSPFAVGFTKKIIEKNLKSIGKEGIVKELSNQYFSKAEEYVEEGQPKILFEGFKNYLTNNFWELLQKVNYYNSKDTYSIIFFLKVTSIDDYKIPYQKYLAQNVFNKADYNIVFQNIIYGISDSLSSFNEKKRFLQHQTASFKFNYRITGEDAQLIWKFYQLNHNKQLPNPLPIFVDENEANLNADEVNLFNNDRVTVYSEIIRSLLNQRRTNLQNFYLFFIHKGKIIDLDFVPVFKYKLKDKFENDFVIKELFGTEGIEYFNSSRDDVFVFLYQIINTIFNRQLVNEDSSFTNFFEDLKVNPKYGLTDIILNLLIKYRKAWYDFIYKSKIQQISMIMINEMLYDSVLDDLRHDDEFKRSTQIRKKLSIWFGVQKIFDKNYKSNNMANKTVELQTKLREIAQTESLHIETDDQFAFAAGQIVWKLLIQSESSNRTHALLEPFLQKTEPVLFKQAIATAFNVYKYKFPLRPSKYEFDKLFSEVMGYDPNVKNMKEHLPMILAGYFSDTIFKKQ